MWLDKASNLSAKLQIVPNTILVLQNGIWFSQLWFKILMSWSPGREKSTHPGYAGYMDAY